MDHFADHQEFTDLGEPAQNAYLDAVLHRTCQQMFGKGIQIKKFFLISIPEYQFFHGPFDVKGRIGGVIFFKDLKIGLLAVSKDFPPTEAVNYLRFSEPVGFSAPNRYDLN